MRRFAPPKIEYRFVCVTSDDCDPSFAAIVSSYLSENNTYCAVFKFPRVDHAYKPVPQYQDDGFISQIGAAEAATRINNALFGTPVEHILLVGLTKLQKTYFGLLPHKMKVELDDISDLHPEISLLNGQFAGDLTCAGNQIARGLLLAKLENKRLTITEDAPPLPARIAGPGNCLIVLESKNDISDVIAVNYAYAIGADVTFVDPISRGEIAEVQQHIYEWKKRGSREGYKRLAREVFARLGRPKFSKYDFVTFFTEGLPYGTVVRNSVPMSHVLRSLREDLFVFNNIRREVSDEEMAFGSAVVFSPEPEDLGEVAREEAQLAIGSLGQNNTFVKPLLNTEATVDNLDQFGGHYPFDLLHICSHGGETDGYYVFDEFADREGVVHKVEYEEVFAYSPYDEEMVKVFKKAFFRKFDGLKWMSPELYQRKIPAYVFEDMRKVLFSGVEGNKARRIKAEYPIHGSCHIWCYDGIHQGQFHIIASHSYPIVFNNTCSSWKEMAIQMLAAGCRGYIGTIWNIRNKTALQATECFYDNLFEHNLIDSVFRMNKSIEDGADRNIYLFWGMHFQSMRKPVALSRQRVFMGLARYGLALAKQLQNPLHPEVRQNSVDIARFVWAELSNCFDSTYWETLPMEIASKLSELGSIDTEDTERAQSLMDCGAIDIE